MKPNRTPADLRRDAEGIAGTFSPLLIEAQRLAASVAIGSHGRRRAGMGESFWQYRQAMPGDDVASIDWRRSGRSDTIYIREREWEISHTVAIWSDNAKSMDYQSKKAPTSKAERARLLSLALSILLSKAGERVAFPGTSASMARVGERHLQRIAMALVGDQEHRPEYGSAPEFGDINAGRSVFISDFIGDEEAVFGSLKAVSESAGNGCLVQILDETEESFPFDGRMIFESMGGALEIETHRAKSQKEEYRKKLEERNQALQDFAKRTGWHYFRHYTNQDPRDALLWIYRALGLQR